MRFLVVLIFGFSLNSHAMDAECTVFSLGSGQDNILVSKQEVSLEKSSRSKSSLGQAEFLLPAKAPLNNSSTENQKTDYRLLVDLKFQEGKSKWEVDQGSLSAGISVYKDSALVAYKETSSNIAPNPSHLRVLSSGNSLPFVTTIFSPDTHAEIMKHKDLVINVTGVEVSVLELIHELGLETTAEHLAAHGIIKSDKVVAWMVNCSL